MRGCRLWHRSLRMWRARIFILLFGCWFGAAHAQDCAMARTELEFPDARQGKVLQLAATAPRDGDALGVVVFSHGFSDQKESYQPLVRPLVCAGWLVLQPNHLDSRVFPGDPRRPGIWFSRVEDVVHILDLLPEIERRTPDLAGRIDAKRIAVVGHSYGAFTAQLVAGVMMTVGERQVSFRDRRVRAIVAIAPVGSWQVFRDTAWDDLEIPLLEVQGGKDRPPPPDQPRRNLVPYDRTKVPGTALLYLPESGHHFGDIYGRGDVGAETDPRMVEAVARLVVAYLEETVKDRANALRTGFAEIDQRWPGLVELSRK
jgi:pimeloyl-ACP methyl ester carboxylesterase